MKNTFLLILFCVAFSFLKAQNRFQIGMSYNLDQPLAYDMPRMSPAHGGAFHLGFGIHKSIPIALSFTSSYGVYAYKTLNQTYVFEDSSTTKTNVQYSSNISKILLGLDYSIGKADNKVNFFISPKLGWVRMNSRIYIEDPSNPDGCEALVNENKFKDRAIAYGMGGGVVLNLDKIRNKNTNTTCNFHKQLIVSASYIWAEQISYVNVKYMKDENQGITSSTGHSAHQVNRDGSQQLTAQFINVSNNNLHEHKIAEVYTSPLSLISFNVIYRIAF